MVKIGDLAKAVMKELDDYGVSVGLEVEKVSKEVAEDTAKMLNKTSPKLTGDYAASWTYGTGETKRTKHTMVVHAEKPEYTSPGKRPPEAKWRKNQGHSAYCTCRGGSSR